MSGPAQYKTLELEGPRRLVLDLKSASTNQKMFQTSSQNALVGNIRHAVRNKKDLRVVLDLKQAVTPEIFQLPPGDSQGHRLVVDLPNSTALTQINHTESNDALVALLEKKQSQSIRNMQSNLNPGSVRDVVIAIDAGHGGQDPGARGPSGLIEKDVVLMVAQRLKKAIDAEPGMRAELVRTGDYFIPLHERRQIAQRDLKADLFVSLHADAWIRRSARGASIFVLSSNGASSTRARLLAEKENSADQIGGGSFQDQPDAVLKSVLVDLALDGSREHSVAAGNSMLAELRKVARMHKNQVEHAGFAVLKTAQMPALLVELGFISNPTEEQQLKTASHQTALANSLLRGIRGYFINQPPPKTYFALARENGLQKHMIARGETLSVIAARYRTSPDLIKSANALTSDVIKVGEVLQIPRY